MSETCEDQFGQKLSVGEYAFKFSSKRGKIHLGVIEHISKNCSYLQEGMSIKQRSPYIITFRTVLPESKEDGPHTIKTGNLCVMKSNSSVKKLMIKKTLKEL
jgi:hypothetical protein